MDAQSKGVVRVQVVGSIEPRGRKQQQLQLALVAVSSSLLVHSSQLQPRPQVHGTALSSFCSCCSCVRVPVAVTRALSARVLLSLRPPVRGANSTQIRIVSLTSQPRLEMAASDNRSNTSKHRRIQALSDEDKAGQGTLQVWFPEMNHFGRFIEKKAAQSQLVHVRLAEHKRITK